MRVRIYRLTEEAAAPFGANRNILSIQNGFLLPVRPSNLDNPNLRLRIIAPFKESAKAARSAIFVRAPVSLELARRDSFLGDGVDRPVGRFS
jgi:hypothetical protein